MPEQQQAPTPQDAYNHLLQNLHAPVFFNKLAQDYGVQPQSRQEALDLLSLGGSLFQQYQNQEKQASNNSRFSGLLNEITGGAASAQTDDALIEKAAAEAAADPGFAQATLLLQAHHAQQMQGQ